MKTEKGVLLVVYKESHGGVRYLVLKRKKNWEGWELPKGHIEEDDYRKTVSIELEEEAGIGDEEVEEIEDLGEEVSWKYEREGEEREKQYRLYLVKVSDGAVVDVSTNPDEEHEQGFFLSFEDASSLLTYENNVEALEKASDKIS